MQFDVGYVEDKNVIEDREYSDILKDIPDDCKKYLEKW